jgi:predicted dehydrogenase
MLRNKLGVGIIGLGIISDAHEKGLVQSADQAQIVAVCDINAERAHARARPYHAAVYTDYHKLLDDRRVDLVDIILPHNLHYPVARDAIEQGKHILIEKPLTLSSVDGADLIARARSKGIKFSVAENTRFVTAYLEVEKILQSGVLGKILSVRTLIAGSEIYRLVDNRTWKGKKEGSGGGVIMDAAPHSFYLLRWLFGGVASMQAFETKLIEQSEVEDNALVTGRLANGSLFTSQFSFTVEAPWTERLEINGFDGALIIDQIAKPVGIQFKGTLDFEGRPLEIPYNPENWKFDSIVAEVEGFIDAVWDDLPPAVDPADANYAVFCVEKAYESINLGKELSLC